jgi:hypothetical protein
MSNPWKRRFEPAHRKPKDRLRGAQLAPLAKGPVKCGNCEHPPGLHDSAGVFCMGCDCVGYVEVPA